MIGARKIVKFIEAITELNNGLSSVNTSAAKSIAEKNDEKGVTKIRMVQ